MLTRGALRNASSSLSRRLSWPNPYFAQNWMLFAPDPLADDRGILARAKCADGRVTEYYDVTSPYIHAAQDSRFFPLMPYEKSSREDAARFLVPT
ncbi:DUF5819 family protein [Streptomyces sp. NBC_01594]|uniref:DUF5819 family protein n=1 Tax=Streptomyces sp. NBC_01594 TaxID=2975890 RepID=UPI00386EC71D